MFKKLVLGLFLTLTVSGVVSPQLEVYPITVIQVNPETGIETKEVFNVSLNDEIKYQNMVYENFTIDQLVVTLKPFDTYRPVYIPKTYTVTYIDGENRYSNKYTYGENVSLDKPSEENHPYEYFLGYFDISGNQYPNMLIKPSGNIILYSKWQGKEYNIIYDGVIGDTYRYGEGATLTNPTKSGYKFEGWYLDGEKIIAIDNMTHGDINLTSKWKKTVSSSSNTSVNWKVNYRSYKNYDEMVKKLDAGYVVYYKGNVLLGHNPGVFSWLPKVKMTDTVTVNGELYNVVKIYKTKFSAQEYKAWWQPGDLALVTCYGGGLNRLIVILEKANN
ncbi:MAG TPA: InlB B-repeat-containing protein [Erysipelotrichaceae bacterium]|jgi:uncharacterized repeat protein (TIGR02543 family)|nr:InlB B-repeat-containing protein [Erysipelotrichaceae bacterium]HQA85038.1 InlB B-repeat-containing protein [Erysipelotrichaceae bacterium]